MIAESRRRERRPKKTEAINAGYGDLLAEKKRKSCKNIFIKHAALGLSSI